MPTRRSPAPHHVGPAQNLHRAGHLNVDEESKACHNDVVALEIGSCAYSEGSLKDIPQMLGGAVEQPKSFSGALKLKTFEWHVQELSVQTRQGKRTILRDIAGTAECGQLVGILGPSGSGKTSLLSCLSLRNRGFTGAVRLDGQPLSSGFFTMAGYVHQDELFFPHLTVREHLTFHGINRVGGLRSRKECLERVEEVIKEVDLSKTAGSQIGGGSFFRSKGLSGGERKRLNIASELLADPSILFLDEPTSGLDAVMGELICVLLKSLAVYPPKRLVFTVIHTPSSRMFTLFSHIMLLSSTGELVYHGRRDELLPFMEGLGYRCPPQFNVADFVLELASSKVIKGMGVATAHGEDTDMAPPCASSALMADSDTYKHIVAAFRTRNSHYRPIPSDDTHRRSQHISAHLTSSVWTKLRMNFWRSWIQLCRERTGLLVSFLMNSVLGLIFGVLYWQAIEHDAFLGRNTLGYLFALDVTILISSCIQVCLYFPMDYAILLREYYTATNASVPYYVGRTLAGVPFSLAFTLSGIVAYFMVGQARDWAAFGNFCLVLFITVFGSQSVGYLTSSFSSNPVVGLALFPVMSVPQILFSGNLYQRTLVRPALAWIQDVSLVNYSYAALVINQVRHGSPQVRESALSWLEVDVSQYWPFVRALAFISVGYWCAAMLVLMVRMRFSKAV